MISKGRKRIEIKTAVMLLILSIFMGWRFYTSADPAFQLNSDRYADSMIAAGMLNVEIPEPGFGLHLLQSGDIKFFNWDVEDTEKEDTVIHLLHHMNEYDDVHVALTRNQQVGIQGTCYYLFSKFVGGLSVSGPDCRLLLRGINAMLLSLILVGIACELGRAYHFLFSAAFYVVCLQSKWVADFSTSTYWVAFTLFLPMLLGLICLNHMDRRRWIYPLVFLAVFVKSLCGYEYLTNTMLCAEFFLAVEWICSLGQDRKRTKELFWAMFGVGLACMGGFLLAICLNAMMRGGGDLGAGFYAIIHEDVMKRTFGDASQFRDIYSDSLNATVLDTLKRYFERVPVTKYLVYLLGISAILKCIRRGGYQFKRDVVILILGTLFSLSWLVLAKSHSYIHIHINPIVFYLPILPLAAGIVAKDVLGIAFSWKMLTPEKLKKAADSVYRAATGANDAKQR